MMPVERKEEKQSSSLISFLPQDDWKKAALAMGVSALLGVAALYLGSNRKPARQVITLDFDPRAMMPNYASVDENPADHALNLNSSAVRELFSASMGFEFVMVVRPLLNSNEYPLPTAHFPVSLSAFDVE